VTPPTSLIITLSPLRLLIFWQETIEDWFVIIFYRGQTPRFHGV
jgi:hypothetical protein